MQTDTDKLEHLIDAPAPFTGTEQERRENLATHTFITGRCEVCDCKPWYASASYPCGTHVPRVKIPLREYLDSLTRA